jgi:hypothetical protein
MQLKTSRPQMAGAGGDPIGGAWLVRECGPDVVQLPAWRARAARGESGAFGVAHVLEVERRGRIRASQMITLHAPLVPNTRRPWWEFWESTQEMSQ